MIWILRWLQCWGGHVDLEAYPIRLSYQYLTTTYTLWLWPTTNSSAHPHKGAVLPLQKAGLPTTHVECACIKVTPSSFTHSSITTEE